MSGQIFNEFQFDVAEFAPSSLSALRKLKHIIENWWDFKAFSAFQVIKILSPFNLLKFWQGCVNLPKVNHSQEQGEVAILRILALCYSWFSQSPCVWGIEQPCYLTILSWYMIFIYIYIYICYIMLLVTYPPQKKTIIVALWDISHDPIGQSQSITISPI